jgi:hypothetical protein
MLAPKSWKRGLIVWKRRLIVLMAVCCGLMVANGNLDGPKVSTVTGDELLADSSVPLQARSVLQRACRDCHSDSTVWPWYAHIPSVSRQMHSDVARGRAFMNLSKWSGYSDGKQRGLVLAIVAATKAHVMPPPSFIWIHGNAKLSDADLKVLENWAAATRAHSEER